MNLLVDHPVGGLIAEVYAGRNNDSHSGWFSHFFSGECPGHCTLKYKVITFAPTLSGYVCIVVLSWFFDSVYVTSALRIVSNNVLTSHFAILIICIFFFFRTS